MRRFPQWIVPTHLSLARLLLVPIIPWLALSDRWGTALAVYLVAAATDTLDGELARQRGAASSRGALLDPAVDKVLHLTVFAFFLPVFPLLIGALMLTDLAIAAVGAARALRAFRLPGSAPQINAHVFGKWKMALQALALVFLFLHERAPQSAVFSRPVAQLALIVALYSALRSLHVYVSQLRRVRTS